ncbi:MAG: ATP-dependent DNA helicase RecG, partial [Clostridia bacterium]|nr:ATP-dependent DNA helicase RecG [Clostridia bacterium]
GENVCVRVSPASGIRSFRARTGARVTQIYMSDGTGVMNVTWFNSPYIQKILRESQEFILFGKVTFRGRNPEMINPVTETEQRAGNATGKIVPVYPCTNGLTQRNIREAVQNALDVLDEAIPDILPDEIREIYCMPTAQQAIQAIHQPTDFDTFEDARRRLAFEEFFILQMGIALAKVKKNIGIAPVFSDIKCIAEFANSLPFSLTNAQKRVINEICVDLKRDIPMNRLVQGDVGSGKTVVAAAIMFSAVKSGYQAVMMAPTEILASQHYTTLSKLFEPWGIEVAFLSGNQKAAERKENVAKIEDGIARVIVGTHALIYDKVNFNNLGLVITDEQHRFGVRQRKALTSKSEGVHTLVMTATPIPRTLSLILYGDLDISIIDELPKGRKKIETRAFKDENRKSVDAFVLGQLDAGRQAYFVCPLIEESEVIEANAVEEYLDRLKKGAYRGRRIEALHGRMKPAEKDEIMSRFVKGEIEALVSTTVIEVGVDVPNATVMVIENAERFGLSQLH